MTFEEARKILEASTRDEGPIGYVTWYDGTGSVSAVAGLSSIIIFKDGKAACDFDGTQARELKKLGKEVR